MVPYRKKGSPGLAGWVNFGGRRRKKWGGGKGLISGLMFKGGEFLGGREKALNI
jgi:hypothetical protein